MTAPLPVFSFQLLRSAAVRKTEYTQADLKALAGFVLASERVKGPVEVALDLTNPPRIQALNRRFRGVDRNTDVIAFRYEETPHPYSLSPFKGERVGVRGFEGDIAINVSLARRQARQQGHSSRREIRLLLIHGILHLLGYTDYEPRPRRRMFKRQNQLLRAWEKKSK